MVTLQMYPPMGLVDFLFCSSRDMLGLWMFLEGTELMVGPLDEPAWAGETGYELAVIRLEG